MHGTCLAVVFLCSSAFALGMWSDDAFGNEQRVHVRPTESKARSYPSIRVTSRLVLVPVTVVNAAGGPVRGLTRENFRLYEDGGEQSIQTFSQENASASIGIVFDSSRSMDTKLSQSREAVSRIMEQSNPGDEFQVVEFNSSPRLLCSLTENRDHVRNALFSVAARGWTSLFDGVMISARLMRHAKHPRRALVILSDGQDNYSRYSQGELSSYLSEAGVVIYSISLNSRSKTLQRLSERTGGIHYSVNELADLSGTVERIGDSIRCLYMIGYVPTNSREDGKYRRIRVELMDSKPGMNVSWRTGYYEPMH